jgi:uncharacterized membrane protein
MPEQRRRTAPGSLASRVWALRDAWRVQLWPVPTLGVTLGVAAGFGLPRLDAAVDDRLPASLATHLFGGGADAARAVLSAIAGSMITVTSLTFSLTVVTLQLASSQYSPRLLRTFSRDRVVHGTLALFLSTFVYALTVLRTVRTADDDQATFVPQLSVTLAFALALASVLALVGFLAHLTGQVRVEAVLRNVHAEASATARAVTAEHDDSGPTRAALPTRPTTAEPVLARSSGFLVAVDEEDLLAAAEEADAVVLVEALPGASVVAGTPVGVAWPRAGRFDPETWQRLAQGAAGSIRTGFERTAAQDVAYGLRQLTDVAVRALSPGVNDPTTAVHALGHSSALLGELADRDLGPRVLRDADDRVRAVLRRPDLGDLLDEAVTQPRRYGAGDPAVLGRLLTLLDELAWRARLPEQRRAIADQLARVRATADAQPFDTTERDRLAELAARVETTLAEERRSEAADGTA